MARRAKLLTLVVFLVLLAVPVAYVVLTWRPVNPLRFRLVDQRMEKRNPFSEERRRRMEVEVQNASAASVYLSAGTIFVISSPGGAREEFGFGGGGMDYIPPHATVRVTFLGEDKTGLAGEAHGLQDARVEYRWISRTKVHALNTREWMRRKLPPRWSSRLLPPLPVPRDFLASDTTPLELAPGLIPGEFPEPEPEFPSPSPSPSDSH